MKKNFNIIKILMKNYWKLFIFQCFMVLVSTFISCISTFSIKILIDILTYSSEAEYLANVIDPVSIFITTKVYGGFDFLKANVWVFSFILVGIAIAMALLRCLRMLIRSYLNTHTSAQLQKYLFDEIVHLPYPTIKKMQNGDILQTCTKDLDTIRDFVIIQTQIVFYTFSMLIISFTILYFINWKLALVSIVILPSLFIYSYFLIKPVRKRYKLTDDSEGKMCAKITENLEGIRVVKAYNNEEYEINNFEKYLEDYKVKLINWRKLSSFFFSSSDILVFGQMIASSLYAIFLALAGEITISSVILASTYVSYIVWPFRDVATMLSNYARVLAALDRISVIVDAPKEDLESGKIFDIEGNIEFKDVSFTFNDADTPTLKNINLKINKGETVAILGKTGSGKSTLAYLLTRLYDYQEGEILIDNVPITEIQKHHLRKNVAIILQEPFLFSKSIMNNLNIYDDKKDQEKIYSAAEIAQISETIENFPNKYDTILGEKGVNLSGGQKQRLSIARGIIQNSPILVMDDSLSAVDTETDIEIRSALKKKMKDTTCLIITHRIATAKTADKIIVLENNTISEMGTYDELINKEGLFKRIAEIQAKIE